MVYFQVLCTYVLCLICLCNGLMFAWPSSTLALFSSANTTLHRPMTEAEAALFGSLSSVGAIISSALTGIFLDRIGRKPCAVLATTAATVAWTMIAASNRVEVILTAVFIAGFSCCSFLVNTTYIVEFCQDSIRGAMTSTTLVLYNIGMLISYVMGGCLSYINMVYANLTISIIGVVSLYILAESPMFLLSKGREQEAIKSLAYYRRKQVDSKEILDQIEIMKRTLNAEPDTQEVTDPEEEKLRLEKQTKVKISSWQFFKKSRSTHRALYVAVFLITVSVFQGLPVLQVYAEPLFAEAVPTLSANMCSIIFAAINVVIGFVAAYLSDAAGRRPLLNYGSLACGVSCLLLGSQIQFGWGPNWLSVVAIYLFSIVYMIGPGLVPFVLIGEVFLPEVKSMILLALVELTWLCSFLILLIFNPLVTLIGLGPVFYIFSAIGFITLAFGYYFMPETKGLSIEAIQPLFSSKSGRNRRRL